MKDLIINGSRQLDIPLDDVQVDKLMEYARLLVEWNEKINLTAITVRRTAVKIEITEVSSIPLCRVRWLI